MGVDPLSVDVVACRFIEVDPSKVEYLKMMAKDRRKNLKNLMKTIHVIEV